MKSTTLLFAFTSFLGLSTQTVYADESDNLDGGEPRSFHCSLLVDGDAFGLNPSRQLGFDVKEGEPLTIEDGWRVSIYVNGGMFTAGTLLFATVTKVYQSRSILTVATEPGSNVIAGVASIWTPDPVSGSGSASIYLTCSADSARGISPDRP